MRGMLGSGAWNMLKLGECFLDVLWHGKVHSPGNIVPFQGEATI